MYAGYRHMKKNQPTNPTNIDRQPITSEKSLQIKMADGEGFEPSTLSLEG